MTKIKKFYTRIHSWSGSARWLADTLFDLVKYRHITIEDAVDFFSHSYEADIIKHRAAKRFGRLIRKNHII